MKWLRKIFAKSTEEVPLRGRPPVRREKSYTAETGYVYQYFYEGFRETRLEDEEGQEYLFTVSSDRVSRFPVRIFLSSKITADWQTARERELNATEQYAVIKMALFATFDRQPSLGDGLPPTAITYDEIEEHAGTLEFV